MKNAGTRITAVSVLTVQWLGVGAILSVHKTAMGIFRELGAFLPDTTVFAIRISSPSVVLAVSVVTTIGIIASEFLVRSERPRFVIQIVDLCFWMLVTTFVLFSLFMPLVPIGEQVGCQPTEEAPIPSIMDYEDGRKPPMPLSVQAHIPRHATIIWYSVINWGLDNVEDMAVLYSSPVLGANDSLKYLELFMVDDDGFATQRDRIYLGGRGLYVIDKISEGDNSITIHAREHQGDDPISTPTRHLNVIVKYGHGVINVSRQYPNEASGSS